MRCFYLLILGFLFSCQLKTTKHLSFSSHTTYVGTYTNGESKGIYKLDLLDDGSLTNLKLLAETENPSFLAKSMEGTYLVAVNETSDKNNKGSLESYKILEDSLMLINKKSSGGAHPCHVSINSENYVVVSNYTAGNIALLKLDEQGKLLELDLKQHFGQGTDTARQKEPHVHSSYFFPHKHQIISADLGTNELWFSEIDFKTHKFIHKNKFKMEKGAGPRHICFHPNSKWIYVLNEMHGSITQVALLATGDYQTLSTVSTLNEDFRGNNYSADIHISSDGRFVYASNRGPDEIVIFKVDEQTGSLSLLSHQATHGNWPRNFALSPDERFLLVAHQYSNNICCFMRDDQTGMLKFVSEIDVPAPVCLLF